MFSPPLFLTQRKYSNSQLRVERLCSPYRRHQGLLEPPPQETKNLRSAVVPMRHR